MSPETMPTLDHSVMLAALMNRDPAFDGAFFAGVITTRIYCRSICPARKPRPENVRFFALAHQAEAAGFRPCKRCKPERLAASSIIDLAIATASPAELRQAVIRTFDLDAPVAEFTGMASTDRVLRDLVARRPGIRLPVYVDAFEGVIRAILGQQVSLAAARTMGERLLDRFGLPAPSLPAPGSDVHAFRAFPTPDTLAGAAESELRALGLTGTKVKAIIGVARAVAGGELDLSALARAPAAVVDKALIALPGIGPWTAAYIRMRALGDRDGFPASDLGVIKALARLSGGDRLSKQEIETLGERWKPWRAYATLHLWASLADTHA